MNDTILCTIASSVYDNIPSSIMVTVVVFGDPIIIPKSGSLVLKVTLKSSENSRMVSSLIETIANRDIGPALNVAGTMIRSILEA